MFLLDSACFSYIIADITGIWKAENSYSSGYLRRRALNYTWMSHVFSSLNIKRENNRCFSKTEFTTVNQILSDRAINAYRPF